MKRTLVLAAFATLTAPTFASTVTITPLASPEVSQPSPRIRAQSIAPNVAAVSPNGASLFRLYPVAGEFGRDFAIPYFVDVDDSAGVRDRNCGSDTFNGHDGHDVYIRSFREQAIGVPVFAPADAVVLAVRDGQPDENTTNDPAQLTNFVVLRHRDGYESEFVHLKNGSITVSRGQLITAGTEIGRIGSSGPSVGPHLHWGVRQSDSPVEPLSGPCRSGVSMMAQEPSLSDSGVHVLGMQFSPRDFADFKPAPYDEAPRTGTYVLNSPRIYFRTVIRNPLSGADYRVTVTNPFGVPAASMTGKLSSADESRLSTYAFAIDVPLNAAGQWRVTLDVAGTTLASAPFTVVQSPSEVVNHAPGALNVTLSPVGLRSGEVPVCRVAHADLLDQDYDVITFRYEWRVNDQLVRSTNSAAHTDALAAQYVRSGASVSCTVTATDGSLSSQPASAFATVAGSPRMRPLGR